jgi:hypothetical protein
MSDSQRACPLTVCPSSFRGLDSNWADQLQENPGNVKRLIVLFHRRFRPQNPMRSDWDATQTKPVIWNGQVWVESEKKSYSCIADYDTRTQWDKA